VPLSLQLKLKVRHFREHHSRIGQWQTEEKQRHSPELPPPAAALRDYGASLKSRKERDPNNGEHYK
jgi:hypothetical protein